MKILIAMLTYDRRIEMEAVKTLINMERRQKHDFDYIFPQSCFINQGRNLAARMTKDENYDYLLFWDSDTGIVEDDFLDKMLETGYKLDAKIVCGAYRIKEPDLNTIRYAAAMKVPDENYSDEIAKDPIKKGRIYTNLKEIKKPQLVDAGGTGIMLIAREVLFKMSEPWFQIIDGKDKFVFPEDWEFCRKAQELGYKIAVDPRFTTRHVGPFIWEHKLI